MSDSRHYHYPRHSQPDPVDWESFGYPDTPKKDTTSSEPITRREAIMSIYLVYVRGSWKGKFKSKNPTFEEYCKTEEEVKPLVRDNVNRMVEYTKAQLREAGNVEHVTVTKKSFRVSAAKDIIIGLLIEDEIHFDATSVVLELEGQDAILAYIA